LNIYPEASKIDHRDGIDPSRGRQASSPMFLRLLLAVCQE
jgi:hypothetical protein